jgi:tRNA threonylcarbamoyladenosine biosynthesis protein TsaE
LDFNYGYAMGEPAGAATTFPPLLSQADLESWGRAVGEGAVVAGSAAGGGLPLVLALRGPLGAGKSVLARAVARGAGVTGPMPSPTYNLLFTYAGRGGVGVHHLDLYRLEDPDDVWELGWEELGEGAQVVLLEWPERAEALLPAPRWDVYLEFGGGDPATDLLRRLRLVRRGDAPPLPPLPRPSNGYSEVGP